MEKYKKSAIRLIKVPSFIVPLIIVAIAGFGYLLAHSTINIDVLSADRYFEGTELIAQQRLLAPIIDKIFHIMDFNPFLVDFISVLFLMLATILFCSLFDVISKAKIKTISYTIFSCFFISYPLMMEIFPYVPIGLSIAIGFCFIAFSLIAFYEYLICKKKRLAFLSICCIWGAISLYESFATVYIMGVLGILLIKILFNADKKISLKECIIEGLKYAVPLIIAVVFNFIITNIVLYVCKIPKSKRAAKQIMYKELGIIGGLENLLHTVIINYFIDALGYLPLTVLLISSIISIIMAISLSIKRKQFSIFIVILGMNVTILLLSIIQGQSALYRTCQQFQLFVAIIFMVLTQLFITLNIKSVMKNAFIFIMFFVIFYQVKDLYHWQYINDLRYQKEKTDMILIGNQIESKYNIKEKPVIFCGSYTLANYIKENYTVKDKSIHYKVLKYYNKHFYKKIKDVKTYKYTQNNIRSYIGWAIDAFYDEGVPNAELIKYTNWLGYNFKAGTIQMYEEAIDIVSKNKIPRWPKNGSIYETDKYILVHF